MVLEKRPTALLLSLFPYRLWLWLILDLMLLSRANVLGFASFRAWGRVGGPGPIACLASA